MKRPVQLVLLIDALGWELAERTGFLSDRLPDRRRLRTILGYSSAAIPSLLTGKVPREHGHWFLYFRAQRAGDSPFTGAAWMARLPRPVRERWALRRRLADWWGRSAGIDGYFGLYDVPYHELSRLDYVERRDTWKPGTFPGGSYIDDLAARNIRAHISDWRIPDDAKLEAALARARSDDPADVYFLYLTEVDARQHAHGSRGEAVEERLRTYRPRLEAILETLERSALVSLTVCSDHGMTDVHSVIDPTLLLEGSGLTNGVDYRVFIDSTFLRFWPATPAAEVRLRGAFAGVGWGHVMEPAELEREGVDFSDERYGRLFVLAEPGNLICPSYMGRHPLKGMHGYTPDDPASDAVLLRGAGAEGAPESILDLRALLLSEAAGVRA